MIGAFSCAFAAYFFRVPVLYFVITPQAILSPEFPEGSVF